MGDVELVAGFDDRLIERGPRLEADDEEIERIWQAVLNRLLPSLDDAMEDQGRPMAPAISARTQPVPGGSSNKAAPPNTARHANCDAE